MASKRTKEFCNRVAQLMRADPITGKVDGCRDINDIVAAVGGSENVTAWLAHTRKVTADAIEQTIREMGLPPGLAQWDIET